MRTRTAFILAVTLLLAVSATAQAPNKKAPESGGKAIDAFTGFAVSTTTGMTSVVEIYINRWSTDDERKLLENVLKASGSAAMVNVMQDLPQVGYIKTPDSMGDALFYARSTDMPDGTRQVVVATNRPLTVGALIAPGASNQYDATVIEMRFPKGQKGVGKIVIAAKASIDPATGRLKLTNWSGEPPRFENITSKTP